MTKFNINDYIFIEIADSGWQHLLSTVGDVYIANCIMPNRHIINGTTYYKLQCHEAFSLMPVRFGKEPMFKPNILLGEDNCGKRLNDKDYMELYYELYSNVAKMLIENIFYNWSPNVLLSKWDSFRK